jgi:single-stranded-DNA-specific exonuclease
MHPVIMHYLFQQGLEDTQDIFSFLYPTVKDFHDPFLFRDMKTAVVRIIKAIKNNEHILIFGDYDADGITATSLLLKCLRNLGANVEYKIPKRKEGYGLKAATFKEISDNISLIITVDNGSTCHKAIDEAKKRGIDTIVTDHHQVTEGAPQCLAFLNPKREDNSYPCSNLSGVGLAFKLVHALYLAMNRNWIAECQEYIELATIGTISDMVPMKDENRTICKLGLEKMNTSPMKVLKKLFEILNIDIINSTSISHQIAPLFNSLGKFGDPEKAVELFTATNINIDSLFELIEINNKRKFLTDIQYVHCEKTIQEKQLYNQPVITLFGNYKKEIIGTLATKISSKYRKPTLIIGENGGGSGRSVCGTKFSLLNTINQCKEHLKTSGGHDSAVGFYIEPSEENINSFFADIQTVAKNEGSSFKLKWYFTEQATFEFYRGMFESILLLEPFGKDFHQPIFLSPPLNIKEVIMFGDDGEHAKLITETNDTFYFYNNSPMVRNYKDQTKSLFYTSTLNGKNEFLVHAIEKQISLEDFGIF